MVKAMTANKNLEVTNLRSDPLYRWAKLPVDLPDDPIVNVIEAEFGTEGFGRFIKLSLQLISQMKFEYRPIVSELAVSRWCSLLGCKKKGLIQFLDYLQNRGYLLWEQNGNIIRIEMPKLAEVFDLSMPSAKLKKTNGVSRQEKTIPDKNLEEEKTETAVEVDVSFLSNEDHDRLKQAMSKSGRESIEATAKVVRSIFSRIGANEDAFSKVQLLIKNQFRKNDNSKQLGDSVLSEAKTAYREGADSYKIRMQKKKDKEVEGARIQKMKNCPNRTDEVCKSVLLRLADHLDLYEFTKEELNHFIKKNTEHWGPEKVQEDYKDILTYLDSCNHNTSGYDDDDDPPRAFSKTTH